MLTNLADKKLEKVLLTTQPKVIMFPTQCEDLRLGLATQLLDVSPRRLRYHLSTNILHQRTTQNVRTDLFTAASWTVPLFSSKRQHWLLGVVSFERHELQYLDSLPLNCTLGVEWQGPQWVFAVSHLRYHQLNIVDMFPKAS